MIEVPSFADVQKAAARIAPYAVRTPLVESPALNAIRGGRVFLKLEISQRTGSFKFRGAVQPDPDDPAKRRAPKAWWRSPPAIMPRAWPRRRSFSAFPP